MHLVCCGGADESVQATFTAGGKVCGAPARAGARAVPRPLRCDSSRDDQLPIEPGHRLGQRHDIDHVAPQRVAIRQATQLGESAAQHEGKVFTTRIEPVSPATHGSPGPARAACAPMHRTAGQQQRQHRLLHGPVVPAPGRDAQGQPRARSQTLPTQEAQHRNRIARLAAGAAIGLAVVAAVSPQATQTAVRAGLRAVALGGRADGF